MFTYYYSPKTLLDSPKSETNIDGFALECITASMVTTHSMIQLPLSIDGEFVKLCPKSILLLWQDYPSITFCRRW